MDQLKITLTSLTKRLEYIQTDEGSIGLKITGVLAEIKMLIWCELLEIKLKDLEVHNDLNERFVDDITLVPTVTEPGLVFDGEKLSLSEDQKLKDLSIPSDRRTMNLIKTIADSLDKNISVSFDVPSSYSDNKVPILDLKVGMNDNGEIEHVFYRKPIANKHLVMKNSAMDKHKKMNTLSQECFRRLHNTSESICEDIKLSILNEFMVDMKNSGYNEKDRLNVLNAGIRTYRNLKQKETLGIRPFYRDCDFKNKTNVSESRSQKKSSWYKKSNDRSPFVSVMYVEATPDDKLIKMIRHTESMHKISETQRIKFVSKSGVKLVNLLQRKDPFEQNCDYDC